MKKSPSNKHKQKSVRFFNLFLKKEKKKERVSRKEKKGQNKNSTGHFQ